MGIIKQLLEKDCEFELIAVLKLCYKNNVNLQEEDIEALKNHKSVGYAFNGIVGLLINNKARILLGKKQKVDHEITAWCTKIKHTEKDIQVIAMNFLKDDFSEAPEVILKKVMIEYPKQ